MIIALMSLTFYLPYCKSLKEKRRIIKSIIQKTSHKFRVSIVESDYQELHQSAQISFVVLAGSRPQGDSMLDNILNYIETLSDHEITEINREFR